MKSRLCRTPLLVLTLVMCTFWTDAQAAGGSGAKSSDAEKHRIFMSRALNGDADAQFWVGFDYHFGHGVAKDWTKSIHWFRMAAGQGHADAMELMSRAYNFGEGVHKDLVLSYAWANLSVAHGNERARELLGILEQAMTTSQIHEAQGISRRLLEQASPPEPASSHPHHDGTSSAEEVFAKASRSIVVIETRDSSGNGLFQGSGVTVSPGVVVTNCHVLEGADSFQVATNRQKTAASYWKGDSNRDICFLKAPGLRSQTAAIGSTHDLAVGSRVYAVGSPQGLQLTLSEGLVSQLRGGPGHPMIQTTAPISQGSSGGGLFDGEGKLVGITTFYLEGGQNLNFALPVEWIFEVESPSTRTAEGPQEARDLQMIEKAEALVRAGDYDGLLVHASAWAKENPDNGLAWYLKGTALFEAGMGKAAVSDFQAAVNANPDLVEAWVKLGECSQLAGDQTGAENAYLKAIEIEPTHHEASLNLGHIYLKSRQFDHAADSFRRALAADADDTASWFGLGVAYSNGAGTSDDAERAFRKAVEIDPNLALGWAYIATIHGSRLEFEEAFAACRKAAALDPQHWFLMGYLQTKNGDVDGAMQSKTKLEKINPDSAARLATIIETHEPWQ